MLCVCVCVKRERKKEREKEREREMIMNVGKSVFRHFLFYFFCFIFLDGGPKKAPSLQERQNPQSLFNFILNYIIYVLNHSLDAAHSLDI